MAKDFKEISKQNYNPPFGGSPTREDLNVGCLQRIADSLEKMEKPYLRLLGDVQHLVGRVHFLEHDNKRMAKRISALQGVITKLKKKNGGQQ